MANLLEAYDIKFETKIFKEIDYFFTQRNLKEEHEFLDKNMNRINKQINIIHNFIAINIPLNEYIDKNSVTIEADIFGDNGYRFKGNIITNQGYSPGIIMPLRGDKKLFVHLNVKDHDKNYICFIEVPKRYQSVDNTLNTLKNDTDTDII